jgi:hypothetical protein
MAAKERIERIEKRIHDHSFSERFLTTDFTDFTDVPKAFGIIRAIGEIRRCLPLVAAKPTAGFILNRFTDFRGLNVKTLRASESLLLISPSFPSTPQVGRGPWQRWDLR